MNQLAHRTMLETLKLLLQVAWADHQIEDAEAQRILERASGLGLLEVELETFKSYLSGESPLPAPDLGLLRLHREQVLATVQQFLEESGAICAEESALVEEITTLLS